MNTYHLPLFKMAAPQPNTYTFKPGDSVAKVLPQLQKQNPGLTMNSLMSYNGLTEQSARRLPVGYQMKIPQAKSTSLAPFAGPSPRVLDGILYAESSNGHKRYGDFRNGVYHSAGAYQIKSVYPGKEEADYISRLKGKAGTFVPVIDDVNRVYGTKYTAESAFNDTYSRDIAHKYLTIYGREFQKKFGRYPTDEELWAMWNKGPQGYNDPRTKAYIESAKTRLANPGKFGITPGPVLNPNQRPVVNWSRAYRK